MQRCNNFPKVHLKFLFEKKVTVLRQIDSGEACAKTAFPAMRKQLMLIGHIYRRKREMSLFILLRFCFLRASTGI